MVNDMQYDAVMALTSAREGTSSEADAKFLRWMIGESRITPELDAILLKIALGQASRTEVERLRQAA